MFPSGCVGLSDGLVNFAPPVCQQSGTLVLFAGGRRYVRLQHRQGPEEVPKVIYMRCDNRIMRLDLERINYIEGMGDYVKIFCKDSLKPILSLCSMKYMEEKLPANEFIRVHRSFIVRMDCISAIGRHIAHRAEGCPHWRCLPRKGEGVCVQAGSVVIPCFQILYTLFVGSIVPACCIYICNALHI